MRLASLPSSWPALQPAHPTLLHHHKPVIPSQPLSGPPLSPRSSTPRRNPQFWLESPPPPPSRSAVPFSADDVSHVSESPDPRSSPTPAMPRSFADAVRLDFNPAKGDSLPVFKSPHGQPPPRPKLKSAITIPAWSTFQRRAYRATPGEEMGVRRIHGTARPGRFNGEWKEVKAAPLVAPLAAFTRVPAASFQATRRTFKALVGSRCIGIAAPLQRENGWKMLQLPCA
uniref:Uncharacterized protein n=1 Tax=Oryza glaberrima TaxID=4538 RepID=I1P3V8_ORYGL